MECSNCGYINKRADECSWNNCEGKLINGGFLYLTYTGNTHRFCSQACWDRMKSELADIERHYEAVGLKR